MEGLVVASLIVAAVASIVIAARSGNRSIAASVRPMVERGPGVHVGKVHRVIDGDTVIVSMDLMKLTLRLDAIDCPEGGQHWGEIARPGLIKMIGGRHVRFENHGQDSYGRTLATIYVFDDKKRQWINVNARMVTLAEEQA